MRLDPSCVLGLLDDYADPVGLRDDAGRRVGRTRRGAAAEPERGARRVPDRSARTHARRLAAVHLDPRERSPGRPGAARRRPDPRADRCGARAVPLGRPRRPASTNASPTSNNPSSPGADPTRLGTVSPRLRRDLLSQTARKSRRKRGLSGRSGGCQRPEWPKPPPRSTPSSDSATCHSTVSTRWITSWRDAVAAGDLVVGRRVGVEQDDLDLAAVGRVDQAGGVDDADAVLHGEPAAGQHEAAVAQRDGDRDAGGDQRPPAAGRRARRPRGRTGRARRRPRGRRPAGGGRGRVARWAPGASRPGAYEIDASVVRDRADRVVTRAETGRKHRRSYGLHRAAADGDPRHVLLGLHRPRRAADPEGRTGRGDRHRGGHAPRRRRARPADGRRHPGDLGRHPRGRPRSRACTS